MGEIQRRWCGWITLGMIMVAGGCGGGSNTHPDTGYGADQTIPAVITCADFCQRSSDCLVDLCDEDKNTTEFQALQYPVMEDCESTCTDALLQTNFTQSEWSCLFQQSCREVLQDDVCHVQATYNCSEN